ncbi:hypothetical protein BDV40DRAFT_269733 [Aspergillus tamarii]|uniref:Uncharacterized protein n=1 Tax=Aspergillus tamarii TaxID=41984 RepID=A0A5N6UQ32_ASPTM|nr:hypothetical protein BDV40DRAFT_269733 [Aspergillus tamarii]
MYERYPKPHGTNWVSLWTGSITESLLAIVLLVLSYYLCNLRSRWSLTSNYLSPTCFMAPQSADDRRPLLPQAI